MSRISRRQGEPAHYRLALTQVLGGRCSKCGSRTNLEIDHILPRSKGGSDSIQNLRLLCQSCHSERHHLESYDQMRPYVRKIGRRLAFRIHVICRKCGLGGTLQQKRTKNSEPIKKVYNCYWYVAHYKGMNGRTARIGWHYWGKDLNLVELTSAGSELAR